MDSNVTHRWALPEPVLKLVEEASGALKFIAKAADGIGEYWAAKAMQLHLENVINDEKEVQLARVDAVKAEYRSRQRKADFELSKPTAALQQTQPGQHHQQGPGKKHKGEQRRDHQPTQSGPVDHRTQPVKPVQEQFVSPKLGQLPGFKKVQEAAEAAPQQEQQAS